jgi:hypothetical protein
MIPSMSRPSNPYDNASCESFIKTLKREEIYANEYRDLEHLRENIATFIDHYYNRVRLHSALGYKPPEEFEQTAAPAATSQGATLSFFRHEEIYRPDGHKKKEPPTDGSPAHRSDESPADYSSASCSPVWGHMIHGQNAEGTQRHNEALGPGTVGRVCSGARFEPVRPVWPRVA